MSTTPAILTVTTTSIAGQAFPPPTNFPVNGFGGDFYNLPFAAPAYGFDNHKTFITWSDIDEYAMDAINFFVTEAASMGLILTTFIYMILLTPVQKRWKPFFTCLFFALISELIRQLCNVAPSSMKGKGIYSAYVSITNDPTVDDISSSLAAQRLVEGITATFSFIFTIGCLHIQTTSLLCNIRPRFKMTYYAVISFLLFAAFVTFGVRTALLVTHMLVYLEVRPPSFDIKLLQATLGAYSISLGSYCLVSCCSCSWHIISRRRVLPNNRFYDSALSILGIIFLESFLAPLIFCIYKIATLLYGNDRGVGSLYTEYLIIPSILVLLPLGSLWTSVQSNSSSETASTKGSHPFSLPTTKQPTSGIANGLNRNGSYHLAPLMPSTTTAFASSPSPTRIHPFDPDIAAIDPPLSSSHSALAVHSDNSDNIFAGYDVKGPR